MSIPGSIAEAQIRQLLDVVDNHQREQCGALIAQAKEDADQILKSAFRDARLRVAQDILTNRENIEREIAMAKAKQQTMINQQRFQSEMKLLNSAWQVLKQQLQQRWSDPAHRADWTKKILRVAEQKLPANHWVIEYPKDWPAIERDKFLEQVQLHTGEQAEVSVGTDISAGIRIQANHAVVDGSLEGLLMDRTRFDAEFLVRMKEMTAAQST